MKQLFNFGSMRIIFSIIILVFFVSCRSTDMVRTVRLDLLGPVEFIEVMVEAKEYSDYKTISGDFPDGWIQESHVSELLALLGSTEPSACYVNVLSSFLPSDSAEAGGFARLFLEAYLAESAVDLGLYSCPLVDAERNEEIIELLR